MLGQTNIWFLLNVQDFATHKKAVVRASNEKKDYENKCIHLLYKLKKFRYRVPVSPFTYVHINGNLNLTFLPKTQQAKISLVLFE